jgi:hypothetical protein
MTEQTMRVANWMKTPEFQARHDAAVRARDMADFECFRVLKDLSDAEMLNVRALLAAVKSDHYFVENETEAKETADYYANEVKRVLKLRTDADQEYGDCIRNIPKRS